MFHVNRTYVQVAKKLKETRPELFEKVKSGEKNISEVKREIREQEIK